MKKIILRFLLLFTFVYLLLFLVISLPGPQKAIASTYQEMANTFVPPFLSKAFLLFEQDPAFPNDPNLIRARFHSQKIVDEKKQEARAKRLKAFDMDFKKYNIFLFEFYVFPLLFFSALVIATPVHWKKKLAALFIGLAFMQIFMFFKSFFITLYHLQREQIVEYQMSAFSEGVIEKVQLCFNNITTALITAILIWGLTVFNKSDWKKLTTQLVKPSR